MAQPCWRAAAPDQVRLEPDTDAAAAARFSLWRLPGRKRLLHDGARFAVCAEIGAQCLRLHVSPGIEDGAPFGFFLPAMADLRSAFAATLRVTALLASPHAPAASAMAERPTRQALLHMRALQALDASLAGASHREVGTAIFGRSAIARRWHTDGELRAQVRHLLRRGRTLMSGGYQQLLQRAPPVS